MENFLEKVLEQDRKLKYLEGKRNQNLQTLNNRIEELVREKQKRKQRESPDVSSRS